MNNKNNKKSPEKSVQLNYKRISLNVPLGVHEKIVKYAEDNGFNYSQAIITLVQKSLQQDILMEALPKIIQAIDEEKAKSLDTPQN